MSAFEAFLSATNQIPCIWETILQHLSVVDLSNCVRVNQQLRSKVSSVLNSKSKFGKQLKCRTEEYFVQNGPWKRVEHHCSIQGDVGGCFVYGFGLDGRIYLVSTPAACKVRDLSKLMVIDTTRASKAGMIDFYDLSGDFAVHPTRDPDVVVVQGRRGHLVTLRHGADDDGGDVSVVSAGHQLGSVSDSKVQPSMKPFTVQCECGAEGRCSVRFRDGRTILLTDPGVDAGSRGNLPEWHFPNVTSSRLEDKIIVGHKGHLRVYSIEDGRLLWTAELPRGQGCRPSKLFLTEEIAGAVYASLVTVFDARNGELMCHIGGRSTWNWAGHLVAAGRFVCAAKLGDGRHLNNRIDVVKFGGKDKMSIKSLLTEEILKAVPSLRYKDAHGAVPEIVEFVGNSTLLVTLRNVGVVTVDLDLLFDDAASKDGNLGEALKCPMVFEMRDTFERHWPIYETDREEGRVELAGFLSLQHFETEVVVKTFAWRRRLLEASLEDRG